VKDQQDKTIERIGHKDGETVTEERWEVQQAWDKQNEFMKAQARAQGELRAMIKQYDEMLHKDWKAASEEQKARLEQIRAQTSSIASESMDGEDDGVEIINDIRQEKETGTDIGNHNSEVPQDI